MRRAVALVVAVLLVSSFFVSFSFADSAQWYSSDFLYRSVYEIDSSLVDEELTDFPVLVYLNASYLNWSRVNDDLSDIVFVGSTQTELSFEVDNYTVNSEAWLWVKLPTISNTSDTKFFMYYGDVDAVSSENSEDVWSNGYVGVWHMNDYGVDEIILDSTSNSYDGDKKGDDEPIQVSSLVANAQRYDGVDDYVNCDEFDVTGTEITLQAFLNLSDVSGYKAMVGKEYDWEMYVVNNRISFWVNTDSDTPADQILTANDFILVTCAYDNSSKYYFVDDSLEVEVTGQNLGTLVNTAGKKVYIGFRDEGVYSYPMDSPICEARISNVSRSLAWVKADYYSLNNELAGFVEFEALYDLGFVPVGVGYGLVFAVMLFMVCLVFGAIFIYFKFR